MVFFISSILDRACYYFAKAIKMLFNKKPKVEFVDPERTIKKITVTNERGMTVEFLSLGASIYGVSVPDRQGKSELVNLQYADIKDFLYSDQYYGKTIGRTSGRIGGAKFMIGKNTYRLSANNNGNNLHGGPDGLDKRNFRTSVYWARLFTRITFRYVSPSGEEGFPGKVRFRVTYMIFRFVNDITVSYEAIADEATPINITNHTYWNLSGNAKSTILEHTLKLDAPDYVAMNEQLVGYSILPVSRTLDFTSAKRIGKDINNLSLQDHAWLGYDHGFVREETSLEKPAAVLYDEASGREMRINTDYPCLNVYSDNYPSGKVLSNGEEEKKYQGIAIEPEFVPFTLEKYVQKAHIPYHQIIRYAFRTK